jgi:hypothetical protein
MVFSAECQILILHNPGRLEQHYPGCPEQSDIMRDLAHEQIDEFGHALEPFQFVAATRVVVRLHFSCYVSFDWSQFCSDGYIHLGGT